MLRGAVQVGGVHPDVPLQSGNEVVEVISHLDDRGTIDHVRHEPERETLHVEVTASAVVVENQDDHLGLLGQIDAGRRIGADRNHGTESDSSRIPAEVAAIGSSLEDRTAGHGTPLAPVYHRIHQGHLVDRQTLVDRQDLDDGLLKEAAHLDLREDQRRLATHHDDQIVRFHRDHFDVLLIAFALPEVS